MVTKLYLRAADNTTVTGTLPINQYGGTPPTTKGGMSPRIYPTGADDTSVQRYLSTTKGGSQTSIGITTLTTTGSMTYYLGKWVSDPLNQTSIAANTWTFIHAIAESSLSANLIGLSPYLYVWRPSNGTFVGWIAQGLAGGWGEPSVINTEKMQNTTMTGSAVTCQVGDVIIIELWARTTQAAAAAYTDTIYFDGATESSAATDTTVSDLASYISTPETIFAGLTRVETVRTLKYALKARIQDVNTIKYALKARYKSIRTLQYRLSNLNPVAKLSTIKYALNARLQSVRTLKYALVLSIHEMGRAVYFDGYTSYLDIADDPSIRIGSAFSFCIRMKPHDFTKQLDNTTYERTIAAKTDDATNGWRLLLGTNGVLYFHVKKAGVEYKRKSAASLSVDTWYELVCVFTGSAVQLYINGVETGTASTSSFPYPSAADNDLHIGRFDNTILPDVDEYGTGAAFDPYAFDSLAFDAQGWLDPNLQIPHSVINGGFMGPLQDMRQYNIALSSTQVGYLYTNKLSISNIALGAVGSAGYCISHS